MFNYYSFIMSPFQGWYNDLYFSIIIAPRWGCYNAGLGIGVITGTAAFDRLRLTSLPEKGDEEMLLFK